VHCAIICNGGIGSYLMYTVLGISGNFPIHKNKMGHWVWWEQSIVYLWLWFALSDQTPLFLFNLIQTLS